MTQLEIEKAKAELEKLQSEIDLNKAKADRERANADLDKLNFVEQETGTKHERDMDKQRGQSQGNQQLKITEALTKPKKVGEIDPDIDAAIGFNTLSDKLSEPDVGAISTGDRDNRSSQDPSYSLGSKFYDPSLDPATNPNLRM